MKHFRSKGFHLAWVLAIIAAGAALFFIGKRYQNITIPVGESNNQSQITKPQTSNPFEDHNSKFIIPNSKFLPVPFTSQAPTANWDELHNEVCEEASAIMAYRYFAGDESATLFPELVEEEIKKLTDWQQQTFGYHLSINTQETVRMIKEVYGLNAEVMENFTADDIKKALTEGKLVLLPANGRLLGNPYYKSPGPIYHMLVIKGFDAKGNFITNDPGTKRGLNYPYNFNVLYNANGNYDHSRGVVDTTAKNVIVVWK